MEAEDVSLELGSAIGIGKLGVWGCVCNISGHLSDCCVYWGLSHRQI